MELSRDSYIDYFRKREPFFVRLKEEVEFILHDLMKRSDIQTHSISGRVKDLNHALEKIEHKGYANPQEEIEDVVGCRVVCLFISDIDRVEKAVRGEFLVRKSEDKVEGGENQTAFGYMSRHYICELRDVHSGARYDALKGIKFELQVRTILMDAWANVSHYLAYKGEASIPEHLRRDFYALSGLFYVADKHFELFFQETVTEDEHVRAQASAGELDSEPANLETVQALLAQLYPNRRRSSARYISELVEEIIPFGYTTISQLRTALMRATPAALQMEKAENENRRYYADVGIARMALALADEHYEADKYRDSERAWEKYRSYIVE